MSVIMWLWMAASVSVVIFGDYVAKLWAIKQQPMLFVIASICYLLSGALYMPILLKGELAVTALIWCVLNIIGFTALGILVFKEEISTMQTFGIILGVSAVFLLIWE